MNLTPKLKKKAQLLMLTEKHLKCIIDLLLKGLSINDIVNHLECVENRYKTYKFIKLLTIFMGKHARRLNKYYDSLVRNRLQVLEVDEVYQGWNSMFIGVVHKDSTYLLSLKQCNKKSVRSIIENLQPVIEPCGSLHAIITDAFPSYNAVLRAVAEGVPHIKCHVHAYRDMLREREPVLRRSRRAYQAWKRECNKVKTCMKNIKQSKCSLPNYKKRLKEAEKARDAYYIANNIQKYSKKTDWSDERRFHVDKLNFLRSNIRELRKRKCKWSEKLQKAQKKAEKLFQRYQTAKTDALQSSRLVADFKRLLDYTKENFTVEYTKLVKKARNSPYSIAKHLRSVLKNQSNYFADKNFPKESRLPPNRVNTNTIESLFGKYRLFINHLRVIKPTEYSAALFELLRLKHNLNGPYTGPYKHVSPIKRLTVGTRYNNFIECLFSQKLGT